MLEFHKASEPGAVHRFWLEPDPVPVYVEGGKKKEKSSKVTYVFGEVKVAVNQRKMQWNARGELEDVEGEAEGWPCYILDSSQFDQLQRGALELPDRDAFLIVPRPAPSLLSRVLLRRGREYDCVFWEGEAAVESAAVELAANAPPRDRHQLHVTSKHAMYREIKSLLDADFPRDSHGKILTRVAGSDSSEEGDSRYEAETRAREALYAIHSLIRGVSSLTGAPHRYSPAFCLAYSLTKEYGALAKCFPEFGRLREMSKLVALKKLMCCKYRECERRLRIFRYVAPRTRPAAPQHGWEDSEEEASAKSMREEVWSGVRIEVAGRLEEWRDIYATRIPRSVTDMLDSIRRQIGYVSESWRVDAYCEQIRKSPNFQYDDVEASESTGTAHLRPYRHGTDSGSIRKFVNGDQWSLEFDLTRALRRKFIDDIYEKMKDEGHSREEIRSVVAGGNERATRSYIDDVTAHIVKKTCTSEIKKAEALKRSFAELKFDASDDDWVRV